MKQNQQIAPSDMTIDQIESLFDFVIRKFKNDRIRKIDFTTNEYWLISTDEWSSFNDVPEPMVCSLAEDSMYLKKTIEEGEITTYSDFDRLASILRAISEMQAPVNSR